MEKLRRAGLWNTSCAALAARDATHWAHLASWAGDYVAYRAGSRAPIVRSAEVAIGI